MTVTDYASIRAAPMFELSGRPARNAQGIEATLRGLRERFGPAGD